MKLTFGKYRNKELADCPKDYLQWLLNPVTKSGVFKVNPAIQEEARRLLEEMRRAVKPTYRPAVDDEAIPTETELQTIMDKPAVGLDKAGMIKVLQDIERYVKDKLSDIAGM